jgi:hypothetical protein
MKIFGYILMVLGAIVVFSGLVTDPTGSAIRQIVSNMYILEGIMLAILGQLIVSNNHSKP